VAVIPFCASTIPREACLGGEVHLLCLASSLVRTGSEGIDCGRVSQKPHEAKGQNWWLYIAWKCGRVQTLGKASKSSEFNSHYPEGHVIRYSENVCCRRPRRRRFAVLPTAVTIETPGVLIRRLTDKIFAHCPVHPNAQAQQIGNYTLADLTNLYSYKNININVRSIYCFN
jgi:hypothetical protein